MKNIDKYLQASEMIDWQHPAIGECARQIAEKNETVIAIARTSSCLTSAMVLYWVIATSR